MYDPIRLEPRVTCRHCNEVLTEDCFVFPNLICNSCGYSTANPYKDLHALLYTGTVSESFEKLIRSYVFKFFQEKIPADYRITLYGHVFTVSDLVLMFHLLTEKPIFIQYDTLVLFTQTENTLNMLKTIGIQEKDLLLVSKNERCFVAIIEGNPLSFYLIKVEKSKNTTYRIRLQFTIGVKYMEDVINKILSYNWADS